MTAIRLAAAIALAFTAPATAQAPAASLKPGEYACYGVGGRVLIGLGFKLAANGRYTDLDGKNPGTVTFQKGAVAFRGGHLAGQVGRNLKNNSFVLGQKATCEPW